MRQLDDTEKNFLQIIKQLSKDGKQPIKIEQILGAINEFKTIKIIFSIALEGPTINYFHVLQDGEDSDFKKFERTFASFYNLIKRLISENWLFTIERDWEPITDHKFNDFIEGNLEQVRMYSVELKKCLIELTMHNIHISKGLQDFIENDFKTNEELRTEESLNIAERGIKEAKISRTHTLVIGLGSMLITVILWSLSAKFKLDKSNISYVNLRDIEQITTPLNTISKKLDSLDSANLLNYLPIYKIVALNRINIRNNHKLIENTITGQFLNKGDLIIVQEEKIVGNEKWIKILYSNPFIGELETGWVVNRPGFFY